jgi:SAM-dependent methyltransferase
VEPKPKGWSSEYGAWFEQPSTAERYDRRPAPPPETFALLLSLIADEHRSVLDAGCGPGDLARLLAPHVDRVDAVDRSPAMIAKGRTMPGGDAPNLRWILAPIEEAPLEPPYSLIAAGDSVHWFDWETTLPRFANSLSSNGMLAFVQREWLRNPEVRARLRPIYSEHAANRDFVPLDPVVELERRGLFEKVGQQTTDAMAWTPTVDELIDCHHSQNGFVLERMTDPATFAREVAEVIGELVPARDGRLQLDVVAKITWGRPQLNQQRRVSEPVSVS